MREERTRSSKPVEVGGNSRPVHAPVVLVLDGSRGPDDELVIGLGAEGLRVILANTGEEGLGLSSCLHPSAIVVSSNLPDLSSYAVLRLLHGLESSPAIAMSRLRRRGGGCARP